MNPESMQEPVADERTHDAYCRVADEPEPAASDNPARQPSGNDPDNQNDNQPLVRQMQVFLFGLRYDSWAGRVNCRGFDWRTNLGLGGPYRPLSARFANDEVAVARVEKRSSHPPCGASRVTCAFLVSASPAQWLGVAFQAIQAR